MESFTFFMCKEEDSIFNNSDTPRIINELCQYGGKKGGSIHFYCDEDIAECIGKIRF